MRRGGYYKENLKTSFLETTSTKVRVSNAWSCSPVLPTGRKMNSRPPRASPHPQLHFIAEAQRPIFYTHIAAGDHAITPSTDHVGLHGAAPPATAGACGIVHN